MAKRLSLSGLAHKNSVLIAYEQMHPLNAHSIIQPNCLSFDSSLHLHPYSVYTSSKCSGQSACLCLLARAFIARQCDKYQHLVCWLNCLYNVFCGIVGLGGITVGLCHFLYEMSRNMRFPTMWYVRPA